MYEFWYHYVIPKYEETAKLCYTLYGYIVIDFIVHVKIDDIYKDIAKDVETRFDTSNYELNRPLQKERTKKFSA